MGRDTTASKRMAAKRSREREAGLRRLNVAVKPEVFDKLTVLMKQHECTSQARLIELLIMDNSNASQPRKAKEKRNAVTDKKARTKKKVSKKQPQISLKKASPPKAPKGKTTAGTTQQKSAPSQMSLF